MTTAQLRECGLSSAGLSEWTRARRIHRLHRGVYALGHRGLSLEGHWMAAVLALGDGAVLSHRSAAMCWGMLKTTDGPVHVTVPSANGRERRTGLVIHRSCTLSASETTIRNNIALTGSARTLEDLRRTAPTSEYRRALRQAEYLRLPIGHAPEADGARSGLERSFIAFCRRRHLPRPEVNAQLGPYTVDFLWRAQKVVVETDSYRTHGGPVAFEEDRARDLWLNARGYSVVRITDRQLDADPRGIARSLRAVLSA